MKSFLILMTIFIFLINEICGDNKDEVCAVEAEFKKEKSIPCLYGENRKLQKDEIYIYPNITLRVSWMNKAILVHGEVPTEKSEEMKKNAIEQGLQALVCTGKIIFYYKKIDSAKIQILELPNMQNALKEYEKKIHGVEVRPGTIIWLDQGFFPAIKKTTQWGKTNFPPPPPPLDPRNLWKKLQDFESKHLTIKYWNYHCSPENNPCDDGYCYIYGLLACRLFPIAMRHVTL